MRGDLERAKCRLVVTADAGLVGHWDRVRLQQVVANLLSNAIKFAAGKDIEITVARGDDDRARLVVTDHGIGIPAERLPHIFGRFERAVSASHYGGLGLGLYIVHAIVQAHGGSVSATSVLGQGATFTVQLPLREAGRR
jgi:signal transduction histidine kinase